MLEIRCNPPPQHYLIQTFIKILCYMTIMTLPQQRHGDKQTHIQRNTDKHTHTHTHTHTYTHTHTLTHTHTQTQPHTHLPVYWEGVALTWSQTVTPPPFIGIDTSVFLLNVECRFQWHLGNFHHFHPFIAWYVEWDDWIEWLLWLTVDWEVMGTDDGPLPIVCTTPKTSYRHSSNWDKIIDLER